MITSRISRGAHEQGARTCRRQSTCRFPGAFGKRFKAEWSGNPVRSDIAAIAPPESGSPDAVAAPRACARRQPGREAAQRCVPQAIASIQRAPDPRDTSGRRGSSRRSAHPITLQHALTRKSYRSSKTCGELRCGGPDDLSRGASPSLSSLPRACRRSGAVSLAVDDHQTQNARFLSERNAALLIPQTSSRRSASRSCSLNSRATSCSQWAKQARLVGRPQATRAVAEACTRLAA